jgi:hypothetical protein
MSSSRTFSWYKRMFTLIIRVQLRSVFVCFCLIYVSVCLSQALCCCQNSNKGTELKPVIQLFYQMLLIASYDCLKRARALKRPGTPRLKESGGHRQANFTTCPLRVLWTLTVCVLHSLRMSADLHWRSYEAKVRTECVLLYQSPERKRGHIKFPT